MKRYFSLFLCALLCIGITGCSKGSGSTEVQTYEKSGVTESTIETSENSKNISDEFSDTKETDKNMTDIVDRDGRHIGQITAVFSIQLLFQVRQARTLSLSE